VLIFEEEANVILEANALLNGQWWFNGVHGDDIFAMIKAIMIKS
jgi:hypothetical protein